MRKVSMSRVGQVPPGPCEREYRYRATATSCGCNSCPATVGHPGPRRSVRRPATGQSSRGGRVFEVREIQDRNARCGTQGTAAVLPGSSRPAERSRVGAIHPGLSYAGSDRLRAGFWDRALTCRTVPTLHVPMDYLKDATPTFHPHWGTSCGVSECAKWHHHALPFPGRRMGYLDWLYESIKRTRSARVR